MKDTKATYTHHVKSAQVFNVRLPTCQIPIGVLMTFTSKLLKERQQHGRKNKLLITLR